MIPVCPPDFWYQVAKRVANAIIDREVNLGSALGTNLQMHNELTKAEQSWPEKPLQGTSEWLEKQAALQTKAGA